MIKYNTLFGQSKINKQNTLIITEIITGNSIINHSDRSIIGRNDRSIIDNTNKYITNNIPMIQKHNINVINKVLSWKEIMINDIQLLNISRTNLTVEMYEYLFVNNNDNINNENNNDNNMSNNTKLITAKYLPYFDENCIYMRNIKIVKLMMISKTFNNLKNKFINDNQINNYFNQNDDIEQNYDITKKKNIDIITSIQANTFLNIIFETYSDDDSIIKQFLVDFPRQEIYVNGLKYTNIDDILMEFSKYNRELKLDIGNSNIKNTTCMLLALLFICQSSFYVSFMHMYNKLQKLKDVLNTNDDWNNPYHNLHIIDHKNKDKIEIIMTDKKLCCAFIGGCKIIDTTNEEIIHTIRSQILFNLDIDSCLICFEAY